MPAWCVAPEVLRHLKNRAHQIPHADAVQISEKLDQALVGIPVQPDGLLCRRDSPGCQYIGRTIENMRKHWRTTHGWSQYPHGGRVSRDERVRADAELQRSFISVTCQQIFPSRKGSHYIHIRNPNENDEPAIPTDDIQVAVQELENAWKEAQSTPSTIQASDITDANPWLRMTRWSEYLEGIAPKDLFHRPGADVGRVWLGSDNSGARIVR
ncbi:uncharacterized protein ATNIH1004_000002 [Aspergillus tanneri]|uniref:Uncharacterized protein n=1 Tax=Aspergillus tanneri TaxID=1220188 RepID=A0A5M9N0J9_9EURO|nr:uncharacterized protein ATNIH1004_000002 [Aspergillus tanneri]KAA8651124.1 hypothetical protein ATNIH1004_000002 [Aspergillus tanneri]